MGSGSSVGGDPTTELEAFKEMKSKYETLQASSATQAETLSALKEIYQNKMVPDIGGSQGLPVAIEFPFKTLVEVIDKVIASGKTPLIVDWSEDNKADTFFSYQHTTVFEAKKMVTDKLKGVEVPEILEDARTKLVASMKAGTTFLVRCAKAAPDFNGVFNDPTKLPLELFVNGAVTKKEILEKIFREEDKTSGIINVRPEFKVIISTQFELDDYEEFLRNGGVPLGNIQPIVPKFED